MAGEDWARRIVQNALNRDVRIHDDNSSPSMYDLRIGPPDAPEVAIECVGAVKSTYTETWNVGPAKGSFTLPVAGNWTVEISPTARIKRILMPRLPQFLAELERRGLSAISHNHSLTPTDELMLDEMDSIGITRASRYVAPYSGRVYLTMPGTGGCVDDSGSELPKWLGDFLRHPDQADVLSKLQRSGATKLSRIRTRNIPRRAVGCRILLDGVLNRFTRRRAGLAASSYRSLDCLRLWR